MENKLGIIKGIHPGFLIARELEKRGIGKSKFAMSLNEYPQTFSEITLGKRNMNIRMALKIEKALRIQEGTLMILQTYYEIEKEKEKQNTRHPDFKKLRRVLFWDTKMENINWEKHKDYVIKRVLERGNEEEKMEITAFYGEDAINKIKHEQKETSL